MYGCAMPEQKRIIHGVTGHDRTVFCFGPFRLDSEAAELWRGPERVALRSKCFDLLTFLVLNHGKLMSRDALLQRVWSDVIVAESTLSRTITEIREALRDDAGKPQYIETVPRRGYKFIASVMSIDRTAWPNVFIVHRHKEYPLSAGAHLVGRGSDVAIRLLAPLISRHHALIRVQPSDVTIEDLGSKNGTLINGQCLIGTAALRPGDAIDIGGEILVLWSASEITTAERRLGNDDQASR